MRFYLYQLNSKLGDMQKNAEKIAAFTKDFGKDCCTLLPSLPLIGQPYEEISHVGGFLERVNKQTLSCTTTNILYESLAPLQNFSKQDFLRLRFSWETRGEFTQQGTLFTLHGLNIFAFHIPQNNFADFLAALPVPENTDLVYFAAAHTFYDGFSMQELLADFAKKHHKALVYVNACGASDGTVFAGQSMLFDKNGSMLLQLQPFCEDSAYFDFDGNIIQAQEKDIPQISADGLLFSGAREALSDYAKKTGIKKAVIGLSGGMDSALVACIACEAMGSENVTGILMPSQYNSKESLDDALALAKNLGMPFHIVHISAIAKSFENALKASFAKIEPANRENDTTPENIQARTRGNLLTAFANRIGAMVIGTGNKSEAAMGYCTLYGDTVGALEPIADIYKSRAYAVAKWYNDQKGKEIIPQNVFVKAPTAELKPGQKDEDTLPPYPYLDKVLYQLLEQGKAPEEIHEEHLTSEDIALIYHRLKTSEFKRKQCPFPVILSSCPFGKTWNPSSSAKVF